MTDSPNNPARARFSEIVAMDDDRINLAEAALWIAAEEYPRMDVSLYLERLDKFAEIVRELMPDDRAAHATIAAINSALYEELGFYGNRENYYDPRNSFLNEVIDRRTGIPITLTIVYIEVARRVGFDIKGVGFPAHFLAKHVSPSGDIYIDPFNGGNVMGVAACDDLFRELTGGRAELKSEYLASVTTKQLLTRMLSNLLNIYSKNDHRRALSVIERILLINPGAPPYIRDHGLLLASVGEVNDALVELESYLSLEPKAIDGDLIREQIRVIKQKQAKWN